MKEFLKKEYGPFTGGVWIVIIVGGVGLGLVMRRFMVSQGSAETAATSPAVGGATTDPTSPAFVGGGTTFNQGEIVSSVLEALQAGQKPPPATTNPAPVTPSNAGIIAELKRRIAGLKAENAALTTQYNNLKTAYANAVGKPAKRAELYAEMEANEHKRRQNAALIANLTAQLKAAGG